MIISICNFQIKLMPRNVAFVCFNLDKICSQFTTARKFLNHICVDNAHFLIIDSGFDNNVIGGDILHALLEFRAIPHNCYDTHYRAAIL